MEIVNGGNKFGINLQAPEDPFMILHVIRRILLSFGSLFALLPWASSPCGSSACPAIEGDLEFDRGFSGGYSASLLKCARCGHGGVPVHKFLPEEFYLRIKRNRRWGDSDCPRQPFFEGYRIKGLLQYNYVSSHFRTIHYYVPTAILFDGPKMKILEGNVQLQGAFY